METNATTVIVTEIYPSIQGESTYAGLPCVFVRLTGCNLRCTYCDTDYAFEGGTKMSVAEVLTRIQEFGIGCIEITGGEPLLQKGCAILAEELLALGYTVLVETSGERPTDVLPAGAIRIMDLKCPSSGECERNNWNNIDHLTAKDEVKFVIGDRADYEWACGVMEEYKLSDRCTVLFSAVHGIILPKEIAGWMIEDCIKARFQLQLHKYIWPPDTRSV